MIDAWGTLLQKNVTQGTAEPLQVAADWNNHLIGFSYDAAGNMLSDGANDYTYDSENRIQSAAGVSYTYDGDGNRVMKSSGTLYWGAGPLAESDASGNVQHEYIFMGSQRIARLDLPSASVHYFLTDHLGSTSAVASAIGVVEDDSDYFPWGGEMPVLANVPNSYKFTGKERDSEDGLDDLGARYYGNSRRRLMTPDEFSKDAHVNDPQSWNRYAYARNNPLRYVDPTGEKATVTTNCQTDAQNVTPCDVTISATIAIYSAAGANLTNPQLQQAKSDITNSIQEAWTGSFTQDGVTYNVTTQVSVQVASSEADAMSRGTQNVVALTNGPPIPPSGNDAGAGAFVRTRTLGAALTGSGPDTGVWDINFVADYAKHEFTHFLGTGDHEDHSMSDTHPEHRPAHAQPRDLESGVWEAVSVVRSARAAARTRSGLGMGREMHFSIEVHAPWRWWK